MCVYVGVGVGGKGGGMLLNLLPNLPVLNMLRKNSERIDFNLLKFNVFGNPYD